MLAKEYEKRLSYGNTRVHDNMVPWALRLLDTTTLFVPYVYLHDKKKKQIKYGERLSIITTEG